MKLRKSLLMLVLLTAGAMHPSIYAADRGDVSFHDKELNEEHFRLLREYLDDRRQQKVAEKTEGKGPRLAISGEVHVEWRHINEKLNGESLRGGDAKDCRCIRLGRNDFDIEFDLRFNYETERTWAAAHIQYDNSAGIEDVGCCRAKLRCEDGKAGNPCNAKGDGIKKHKNRFHGSGSCDDLCLKRAYMGYNIFSDCGSLDVELGRRSLYDVFESEIEFLNRLDGIVFHYEAKNSWTDHWYIQWAGFLIDERVNHFGWGAEVAFFNICESQLDFKYSIIDWRKRGWNRCGEHNPRGTKYLDSQILLTYHLPKIWNMPAEVYGAGLYNHLARHAQKGWGTYVGFTLGDAEKAGSWSVDIQYQAVMRDAIAWDDENGICVQNILEDCGIPEFPTTAYQGFQIEFLYALTDDIVVDTIYEQAWSLQHRRQTYSKFEIEAVYAF